MSQIARDSENIVRSPTPDDGATIPFTVLAILASAAEHGRVSDADRVAGQCPPADAWLTEPGGYSLSSKHTTLAALTSAAAHAS